MAEPPALSCVGSSGGLGSGAVDGETAESTSRPPSARASKSLPESSAPGSPADDGGGEDRGGATGASAGAPHHSHADAANVGAQREVGRALANLAACADNHVPLLREGGLALCMDLVVSNSPEVQAQATRALANLALSPDGAVPAEMVDEGVLELLVLLAASWDEGVQTEAAIALANFAARPEHRTTVIRVGALEPLLEQLKSPNAAVRYFGALGLMAIQ